MSPCRRIGRTQLCADHPDGWFPLSRRFCHLAAAARPTSDPLPLRKVPPGPTVVRPRRFRLPLGLTLLELGAILAIIATSGAGHVR